MHKIDRRMAGGAIGAATVTLAGVPALASVGEDEEPGQLAALVRRYLAEMDAFNASDLDDEAANKLAEATFDVTLRQMIGVPARSAGDALDGRR